MLFSSGSSDGESDYEESASQFREGSKVMGYCLKCREHREVQDAQAVTMKNGRVATRGSCGKCGTTMFRIGKSA